MARSRNIKPGFFTNELLGTYDPIVCLTFAGLWCLADKDGRMEDRPMRIKAELFPYREGLDVNGYLTVLERGGFIERYSVDGVGYIQVVSFAKHQSPHHTERPKGFPANNQQNQGLQAECVLAPLSNRELTVPTRSDSLIPDSLIHGFTDSQNQSAAPPVAGAPPPKKRSSGKSQAKSLDDWLTECESKGEKPIPDDDPIREWADNAGIPHDYMRLAWVVFVSRWQGKKPQKDWRATFRNAIRDNWLKLWYVHPVDGDCRLTTSGEQERRANV
jgi:hypothetical protein